MNDCLPDFPLNSEPRHFAAPDRGRLVLIDNEGKRFFFGAVTAFNYTVTRPPELDPFLGYAGGMVRCRWPAVKLLDLIESIPTTGGFRDLMGPGTFPSADLTLNPGGRSLVGRVSMKRVLRAEQISADGYSPHLFADFLFEGLLESASRAERGHAASASCRPASE